VKSSPYRHVRSDIVALLAAADLFDRAPGQPTRYAYAEALLALGERVHSVHLKDWIIGGEEQIVGKGDMDLEKVAQALKDIDFDGPILFEYEMSPSNPVADMQQGLANWRAVQ